jgi:hypothetical protein
MAHFSNTMVRIFMRLAQVASVLCVLLFMAVLAVVLIGSTQLARVQHSLRPVVESELRTLIGRDVRIGSVKIQGLNELVFQDMAIASGKTFADGTAVTANSTRANINLFALVLQRGRNPVDAIDRITVTAPDMEISRTADGRWNFQDILDRLNANRNASPALRAQVVVADGRVTVRDAQGFGLQKAPMTQRLVGVRGTLSSRGGQQYAFQVSARGASSRMGAVTLAGNYSGEKGSTSVTVSADDIAVNAVAKFLPKNLPITFENGTAALRLSALFTNLPAPNHSLSTDKLTAEVDLSGVGLRLREMSSPIMATSGRLRLVHDSARYPRGSRLEFINVRARAGRIPLTLAGKLTELNLFDLAHAQPQVALTLTASGQGPHFQQLFPKTKWLQDVTLAGNTKLVAEATGKSTDLRIDGTVENAQAGIRGLQLDGASAAFRLATGVTTAGTRPSLTLTARVRRAGLGESNYQNLRLALSSNTPWHALTKDPLLRGSASVGEARMPWGAAKNIRGKVTVTRAGVQFDEIRAGLFDGEVTAGPMLVPLENTPGGIILSADGNYREIDLAQLTKALNLKDLSGMGRGTISLTLDDEERLHIDTELHATGVIYQDKRVNDMTATLRLAAHRGAVTIDIPRADARTEYGRFTVADGSYRRDADGVGSGELHLPVRGEQVNLPKFYARLTGEAQLEGTVQDDISAPRLIAHVTARDGVLLGREFTHGESDVEYSADGLWLRNIVFTRDGMTGRVVDDGKGLDPRKSLVGLVATLELHGAGVDTVLSLFEQQSPWRIDGGTFGTVDVRYTDRGLEFDGQANIPDAIVQVPTANGEYPLELDRLGATFAYAERKMQIQHLALERNATTVHGRGSAESPLGGKLRADVDFTAIQARLEDLPLDLFRIPIPLHGEAQIAGALHGVLDGDGPDPMTVDMTITTPQFAAAGLPMEEGSVDLQYRYHNDTRELVVRRGVAGGAFDAEGAGHFYLNQQRMEGVKLAVRDIDLARLTTMMNESDLPITLALPDGVAGQGRVELTVDGSYAQPNAILSFNFDRLAFAGMPLPDMRGQLHGKMAGGRYRLHVDELAASSAGVDLARVMGDIDPGRSVDLQVSADNLTAKILEPWVPDLPFDGRMDFTGALRGPWKDPALDGDLRLANLQYAGRAIPAASGHIRLDRSKLALLDGLILLLANGEPVRVSGHLPVRWENFQPVLLPDGRLALDIDLPRQDLAALRPLLPSMVTSLSGSVEGGLRVTGTAAQPRFDDGWVEVRGNAGFDLGHPGFGDSVQNLDLRASIAGDPQRSTVTIERLTAGISRKKDVPGSLDAVGSLGITSGNLLQPQRWQWDVYAAVDKLPLPAELMVAPKATGALHLVSEGATPEVRGVLLLEHVKLKEPKMAAGGGDWGPFTFDPRLAVAVQVGDSVNISKSIFSVPLRRTPLPYPAFALQSGATSLPVLSMVSYDNMLRHAGTANEMTGTWGTITGTLNDPQVYARFEVDKGKLSFPLNLIGSVRHARGHVTYTRAGGPQIVMGIPDFPVEEAKNPESPAPTAPVLGLR